LEPIFNSVYSTKNLPKESKLFSVADNAWKKIMKINKDATAERWANNEQALTTLRQNNATFEVIQKVLDEFLEKKREYFQRFFFLSND
jgi:dynein heavy chain